MRGLSCLAAVLLLIVVQACGAGAFDPAPDERLAREIVNGELMRCYFDAEVTLQAGKVETIVRIGAAANGKIAPGMEVKGAREVFGEGSTIPVPVHLDEAGNLRGSYAECESIAE